MIRHSFRLRCSTFLHGLFARQRQVTVFGSDYLFRESLLLWSATVVTFDVGAYFLIYFFQAAKSKLAIRWAPLCRISSGWSYSWQLNQHAKNFGSILVINNFNHVVQLKLAMTINYNR